MMSSVMPSLKYSCSGSPLMFANGSARIEDALPVRLEAFQRARFVALHEAAVADDVGRHDDGEFALHPVVAFQPSRAGWAAIDVADATLLPSEGQARGGSDDGRFSSG